jgi:hypothetical protein
LTSVRPRRTSRSQTSEERPLTAPPTEAEQHVEQAIPMRRGGLEPPPGYPGRQPGNPGVRSVQCVQIVRVSARNGRKGRSRCCRGCCHGLEVPELDPALVLFAQGALRSAGPDGCPFSSGASVGRSGFRDARSSSRASAWPERLGTPASVGELARSPVRGSTCSSRTSGRCSVRLNPGRRVHGRLGSDGASRSAISLVGRPSFRRYLRSSQRGRRDQARLPRSQAAREPSGNLRPTSQRHSYWS